MRNRRTVATGMTAAVALLSLAACGGAQGSGDSAGQNSDGPITVQTAQGPVELPGVATRVVALEWTHAENLLALGKTPVGVADMAGFSQYVTAAGELPSSVTDVGTRQEPDLEAIAGLTPDLIITDTIRLTSNVEELNSIAPVIAFDPYAKDATQLENMKEIFTEVAKAVGAEDKADEILTELSDAATETADQLESAGFAGSGVAVAQNGGAPGAAPAIRMYTDESLVMQVLGTAGLKTAWPGEADDYGLTTVGIEALSSIPADAQFLYSQQPTEDLFTEVLPDEAVWNTLGFVEAGNVKPLDPGTWFFGGPMSCIQILEEAEKALGA